MWAPAGGVRENGGSPDLSRSGGGAFRFTTRDLDPAHQFEAYRAFCAPLIDLELSEYAASGYAVDCRAWDLGRLVFGDARLPGPPVERRWRHVTRDPLDHWCLVLGTDPAPAAPRLLGLRVLARPFAWQACDTRVTTLFIPRELFGAEAGLLDRLPPQIEDRGLGSILADHMESLARNLPTLRPDEIPRLVEATRALLAACLAPSADRIAEAGEPIAATLRERARQAVRRHIRSPALGPDLLCRELGVSRSRLYRLFEPLGGVMRYIQRQRLLAAHAALSDVANERHIVQVAESYGFTDASGFSRAFRTEFGYTPREAREAAHSGIARPPAAPRGQAGEVAGAGATPFTDIGGLLRGLSA